MNGFKNWLMEEESGQGMVEYALIIVLIAVVAVTALTPLGNQVKGIFDDITGSLGGKTGGGTT